VCYVREARRVGRYSDAARVLGMLEVADGVFEIGILFVHAHLVVVDDGRLVGIVTRADLVRAYVRSDQELAETIRQDVVLRILWLDPAGFVVNVKDGVATIVGGVESRSTAEMVGRAVAMVPGIVDVKADVTWSLDDTKLRPPAVDPFFPFGPR